MEERISSSTTQENFVSKICFFSGCLDQEILSSQSSEGDLGGDSIIPSVARPFQRWFLRQPRPNFTHARIEFWPQHDILTRNSDYLVCFSLLFIVIGCAEVRPVNLHLLNPQERALVDLVVGLMLDLDLNYKEDQHVAFGRAAGVRALVSWLSSCDFPHEETCLKGASAVELRQCPRWRQRHSRCRAFELKCVASLSFP